MENPTQPHRIRRSCEPQRIRAEGLNANSQIEGKQRWTLKRDKMTSNALTCRTRVIRIRHRWMAKNRNLLIPVSRKARAVNMVALEQDIAPHRVFLVVRRKPLSEVPWLYRVLARWVYFRIGWASDYSVEYQGIYTDEAEARWAASGPGLTYSAVPLNASLPLETCQYGMHDAPLSDASHKYRDRRLPFVAVTRKELDSLHLLGQQIDQLAECLDGKCVRT